MSSLHFILIALGVGLVAVLALYNHLQERRYRQQVDRLFERGQDDPRLDGGGFPEVDALHDSRIEPDLHLAAEEDESVAPACPGDTDASPFAGGRWGFPERSEDDRPFEDEVAEVAPEPVPTEAEPAAVAAEPAEFEPESPLDAEIEYVARLRFAHPQSIDFSPLLEGLRRISKPMRAAGRRGDGVWEAMQTRGGPAYGTVEFALLLADRSGPVSEVQLDSFLKRLYGFVEEHGGAVSCPDKAMALERAADLDAFCAGVDVQIGVNVVAPAERPFSVEVVTTLVTEAGMTRGADGNYALRDASGLPLISLVDREGAALGGEGDTLITRGVSLALDVPRVAQGVQAFDRMTDLALSLSERLGGELVDDGSRAVTRESLDRDRKLLQDLYARMEQRGLPAGGSRALRLFS